MKTRELRLPPVVSSFNATRIVGTFGTLGSTVYRVAAALAGLLSSVAISGCSGDCRSLRTSEGERLKVTIVREREVCGQVPLNPGDEFLIDMGETYRDDSSPSCLGRIGRVTKLPSAFSEALLECGDGEGFGTYVKCAGRIQANQCGADALVGFPVPPENSNAIATGTVDVRWATSCWPRNCYGDLRDSYDATIERVGMGWAPPAE